MRPGSLPLNAGRLALLVGLLLAAATTAGSARTHRRHVARHRPPVEATDPREARPATPDLESRAAYQSGFAFGLLDLGISGTPTAVSPYAPAGYGFRRPSYHGPGYYGPGYGYPGY